MPSAVLVVDNAHDIAERKRFESFKLGGGLPAGMTPSHSHRRSHSRNVSVSLAGPTPPLSNPTSPEREPTPSLHPSDKRHSHHKRLSSVSTRTESAELMGISIPSLPSSSSDDNVNLGGKDSIRRRALWALEGKPDLSFSKVEIPELSDSASETTSLDFSTKSSGPQNAMPNFGPGLIPSKRDSFKLLASSSSSKDQLGTLIEEEEDEDENPKTEEALVPTKSASRPRPATLNLKPLSLTPDSLFNPGAGLPTPTPTPSPQLTHKALNACDEVTNAINVRDEVSTSKSRPPLNIKITSGEPRRSSLPMAPEDAKSSRRSSIGYKTSTSGVTTNFAGLPTPEITPTSVERRFSLTDPLRHASASTSASDEEVFTSHPTQSRPLSASEQHFLVKSHNALLARITDLERALSMRRMSSGGYSSSASSRSVSMVLDLSSSSDVGSAEPNDEMLRLVADLKAERDELKRDVDGWRTRVADMEKQLSIVAGRVESERRDAWVARSMSGLLEVEKRSLERKLEATQTLVLDLQTKKDALSTQNNEMQHKIKTLESELEHLRTTNVKTQERSHPPLEFTLKRFTSVDSGSSTTDVEESGDSPKAVFELRSVEEEEESTFSDEDNGLAGYEDEEDSDPDLTSSSFDSESPRSTSHLELDVPVFVKPDVMSITSVSTPEIQAPRPTHASHASLSKTWTFPRGTQSTPLASHDNGVDHFFDCLKDEDSESSRSPFSPLDYSYERSKGLFAAGFKYATEDDAPPFFLPPGVGIDSGKLDVVVEETEEETLGDGDDTMFGDVGGIQVTLTPPQEEDDTGMNILRGTASVLGLTEEDSSAENSIPFNFGRRPASPPTPETPPRIANTAPVATPPSVPRPSPVSSSPSSIPRAISLRSSARSSPSRSTASSPKTSPRIGSPSTSPTKRGGTLPSFIPQPKLTTPTRAVNSQATSSQFPRQSPLKSLTLANGLGSSGNGYGSTPLPQTMSMRTNHLSVHRSRAAIHVHRASSEIKSIDISDPTSGTCITPTNATSSPSNCFVEASPPPKAQGLLSTSFSSSVPSPRLSFQTFTNFIPSPWSPRPASSPKAASEHLQPITSPAANPSKRSFVSKEAQLEKLRIRLAREGSLKMKTFVNVSCKRCGDQAVSL